VLKWRLMQVAMPMRIKSERRLHRVSQSGVSLIELIVFIVIVSIALLALTAVFQQATKSNADPLIRVRTLEAAQSLLDDIIALKYDGATPSGGVPACGATGSGISCNNTPDSDLNDVDDYSGYSDTPYPSYTRQVTITANSNRKLIQVKVTNPLGESITLAAERANF